MTIEDLLKLKIALHHILDKCVDEKDMDILVQLGLVTLQEKGTDAIITYPNDKDVKDILNKIEE